MGATTSIEWVERLTMRCLAAGVKVFVKQLGSNVHSRGPDEFALNYKADDPSEWPTHLRIQQFPDRP